MSATRLPFVEISPDVGRSRSATRDSRVLLPQPEAPIRQTNSPGAADREMPSSATTADAPRPNVLETPEIWIAASGLALAGPARASFPAAPDSGRADALGWVPGGAARPGMTLMCSPHELT